MTLPRQVAKAPAKPVMIYDGDCRFCTRWVRRWMRTTGDAVEYVPSQDDRVASLHPELPREQLAAAVCFIDTNGAVYQGAEAVFRALAKNPKRQRPLRLYQRSPFAARVAEGCYRFIARHRSWLG